MSTGRILFVANAALSGKGGEPSVVEVNQATGAVVRVISGRTYQFDGPDAMVVDGPDLFVLNGDGNSVTELPG